MSVIRNVALSTATLAAALLFNAQVVHADAYSDAVQALNPTHYYHLDETTIGTVADVGSSPINGTHEGIGVNAADPEVFVGDGYGQVGVPGPDAVYKYDGVNLTTIPLPGFSPNNRALFNNDSLAVNLGPPLGPSGENLFAHTTMTIAAWFKFPNADLSQPGVVETGFGPGNGGGERLFTNNFNGQDLPGTSALDQSDVDDLGHFQIDLGGANFIVSIDNNFSDPLKSNYQIVHRYEDPVNGISVKDASWHHVVVSRNGDDIYDTILVIDGELISTDRYANSTDSWGIDAPFDARIGTRMTAPHHQTWGGWIDEMAIWIGRQLTAEEAISMWNAAAGITAPGDFDGNGTVEGHDFMIWQQGQGSTFDASDLQDWKNAFGTPVAAVPEPSALALAAVACALGAAARRRRLAACR